MNQVGYLPDAPKVAVVCTLTGSAVDSFTVGDERGQPVLGPPPATADRPFGPCATHGLDFSALTRPGRYRIVAGDGTRPSTRDSSCITYDFGDYSTNEPIMDGTANLTYLVAALAAGEAAPPLPLD